MENSITIFHFVFWNTSLTCYDVSSVGIFKVKRWISLKLRSRKSRKILLSPILNKNSAGEAFINSIHYRIFSKDRRIIFESSSKAKLHVLAHCVLSLPTRLSSI